MKVCTKCGFDYPAPVEEHFSKKKGTKDGLQYICKSCNKKSLKLHYEDNKQSYIDKAKEHNKIVLAQNRQFCWDYLSNHPCVDCGESDPVVLEFDHVSGDKYQEISIMVHNCCSLATVKAEIEKCEVRCANCHRRKTAKQFNYYKCISK